MSEANYEALADAALERMLQWDLRQREKFVYGWIVELSYKRGRMGFWLRSQGLLCLLTGMDKAAVSRVIDGLKATGVLRVVGARNGMKWVELLPNGRLIEPEKLANPDDVRRAIAEIENDNASGPGVEPGGQRRLSIATDEERLAGEQAAASRELAVEGARFFRAGRVVESTTRGSPELSNRQQGIEPPQPRVYARAPETLNVSYHGTTNVRRLDVGAGAEENGTAVAAGSEAYALEKVREIVPPEEFEPWQRKWEQRCGLRPAKDAGLRPQPALVIEAVGEIQRDLREGKRVENPGGSIVWRVRKWLGEHAGTFRLFQL